LARAIVPEFPADGQILYSVLTLSDEERYIHPVDRAIGIFVVRPTAPRPP
jgi:hypothetical protein